MSTAAIRGVVRRLGPPADPPTDTDLVTAFAARRDPDAFSALVARHGPTVFGACRRVLGHAHDAEDAFQAVFLVLAQRVKTIRPPGAVGGWLYGVAVRTANKAKVAAARRRRRDMIAASKQASREPDMASRERERPEEALEHAELQSALDDELARLPETLRAVVVLCDLHGKTRVEAAAELGCPDGTVAARLHRARKKLASALARRGLALPVAGFAALLAPAAVSAATSRSAIAAALGSASPAVLALAREVTRSMTATTHAVAVGMVAMLAGGLLAAGSLWPSDSPAQPLAPRAEVKVEEPTRKNPVGPWKESKVLELDGWLAGSAVYSGDGTTLFVGGTNGNVRAYDTKTWKLLWDHEGKDRFAAIAVSPDGKTIAATFKDGVKFLDAATGKAGDILEEKGSEPLAVAYLPLERVAPDVVAHKLIFGNARGYFIKLWLKWPQVSSINSSTVAAGKEPADPNAVPLAVDPAGRRVVVTGPIDPATGKNVLWAWSAGSGEGNKILEGHKAVVTSAAWSKDGKSIVTGDASGNVITWDAATFKEKSRLAIGGRVAAVAISNDGTHTAASTTRIMEGLKGKESYAENLFVWESANPPMQPKPIAYTVVGGVFSGVASLAFTPDGKSLASAFCNFNHLARTGELVGKVRIYSTETEPMRTLPGYVTDVQYSPDGKRFAVAPGVTVRDATGKTLYTVPGEAAGFTADGKTLFVMGEKVIECDAETGKIRKEHPRPKTKFAWHLVSFAPDGKRYAAHFGFNARVYDIATGFEPQQLDNQHEPGSSTLPATTGKQLIWSPDGKQVAAVGVLVDVGKTGMAGWEVESGKRFYSFASDFTDGPRAVAFSRDSKSIAIGYEKRVDVWTGGLNPVKKLGEQGLVTALAFTPDGKMLAAGIRLPILHGGEKVPRVIGHKTEVRLIEFATDNVVKVFDGFEGVNHMASTKLPVTALAFRPDGKSLVAGTGLVPMTVTEVPKDLPATGELKVFDLTAPADPDVVKNIREQLKSGTPREKSAALNTIRDLKSIKLIPDLIEAIEDPTSLPREGDTGWGFVGHQAASVLKELARDIDGIDVGMGPGKRAYQSYSFHNDSGDGGQKLKESGRLAEVRKSWAKWWDGHRNK